MQGLWIAVTVAAGVAGTAALGERRRARRADIDRVGWVPWPAVLLTALFAGAICAGLALHG